MVDQIIRDWRGAVFALGAKLRAHDPREYKYRLTAPAVVDLSRPRSLAPYVSPVRDQGQQGACVAFATCTAAETLARIAGARPPALDELWLYARCRQKEGSFPSDSGSFPADALDLAMVGLPPLAAERLGYLADPTYNPGPEVDAAATIDYVLGHQPFYGTDPGGFLAGMVTALDAQKPVVLAMAWHQDFFTPVRGVLPVRPNDAGVVGGHAICAWGYVPPGNGHGPLVACRNSWAAWTDADVATIHPDAVPGDFFVPAELLTNGIAWEARAVSGEAVTPQPPPVSDGWDAAIAAARAEAAAMQAYAAGKPASTSRHWWSLGGWWMVSALEAAKPGATEVRKGRKP